MARKRSSPAESKKPAAKRKVQLYTLEVFLLSGFSRKAAKRRPVVSRTIDIRGDQTLEDLHEAAFDAFDRFDEHLYEFQFGKKPMDREGPKYGVCDEFGMDNDADGFVNETTIESLRLTAGRSFWYWFDFGDDWWHQIDVVAIADEIPKGKYPKVTKRVGKSPPQYPEDEYSEDE